MRARTRILISCLLTVSLAACASAPRHSESDEPAVYDGVSIQEPKVEEQAIPDTYGPPEVMGPEAPPAQAESPQGESVTPPEAPPAKLEPKLCVVLGPGMARAIAHAAVLEAIKKADIPVHCVVGSEMGAVVGALYAHAKGSMNKLQWQLFKFNKENYFNFPMLSLREPKSSGKKLHDFLREILRDQRMEDLPIRFAATATEPVSGAVRNLEKGDLADALSSSLAMPGIFEPWRSDEGELVSGAVSSPAPVELARSLGGTFVVLVDVIDDGSPKAAVGERFQKAFASVRNLVRLQKKEANFVLQVKAGALPYDDFSRQGEILAAGAAAAEGRMEALKSAWEKAVAEK